MFETFLLVDEGRTRRSAQFDNECVDQRWLRVIFATSISANTIYHSLC